MPRHRRGECAANATSTVVLPNDVIDYGLFSMTDDPAGGQSLTLENLTLTGIGNPQTPTPFTTGVTMNQGSLTLKDTVIRNARLGVYAVSDPRITIIGGDLSGVGSALFLSDDTPDVSCPQPMVAGRCCGAVEVPGCGCTEWVSDNAFLICVLS